MTALGWAIVSALGAVLGWYGDRRDMEADTDLGGMAWFAASLAGWAVCIVAAGVTAVALLLPAVVR